eukprot:TRINITY_DN8206_c0_g1_i3.p1 TRINITY_DN8206_c0_g1~~TRINITY_DN8206_c0_g1_i3.p1  ORF type:complete len:428 (-),score=23.03 TRINITY_DN8206_c0_g1_i3:5-1288(-)
MSRLLFLLPHCESRCRSLLLCCAVAARLSFDAADAYPMFWKDATAEFLSGFREGGPFGPMGIENFENRTGDGCVVSVLKNPDTFFAHHNHTIVVNSSQPVGHLLVGSDGNFVEIEGQTATAYTPYDHTFTTKQWTWQSTSLATEVTFFAICSNGKHFGSKAWYAKPMKLFSFQPCLPSDAMRIKTPCQCAWSSRSNECSSGQYCWTGRTCSDLPKPLSTTGMLLHAVGTSLGVFCLGGVRVAASFTGAALLASTSRIRRLVHIGFLAGQPAVGLQPCRRLPTSGRHILCHLGLSAARGGSLPRPGLGSCCAGRRSDALSCRRRAAAPAAPGGVAACSLSLSAGRHNRRGGGILHWHRRSVSTQASGLAAQRVCGVDADAVRQRRYDLLLLAKKQADRSGGRRCRWAWRESEPAAKLRLHSRSNALAT